MFNPFLWHTLPKVVKRKELMVFKLFKYVNHQRCHEEDECYDKEERKVCFSYAVCVFDSSEGDHSISSFLQDVVLVLREDGVDSHRPQQIWDYKDWSEETEA